MHLKPCASVIVRGKVDCRGRVRAYVSANDDTECQRDQNSGIDERRREAHYVSYLLAKRCYARAIAEAFAYLADM